MIAERGLVVGLGFAGALIAGTACGSSSAAPDASPGAADAMVAGTPDATVADAPPPPPCEFAHPLAPPPSVLWPAELSATGDLTLGGHGHDDGHGAAGFCAGTRVAGAPFFRLVAAGLGVDFDIDGSGGSGDSQLAVDFWRDPPTFDGFGESGGNVAVYVDIVDENGVVLNVDSAPEIRVEREILDGPTEDLMLTSKPPNEFQTNYPMVGGGQRYGFGIAGASDRVINLRLPNNHHLTYVLVFRREPP